MERFGEWNLENSRLLTPLILEQFCLVLDASGGRVAVYEMVYISLLFCLLKKCITLWQHFIHMWLNSSSMITHYVNLHALLLYCSKNMVSFQSDTEPHNSTPPVETWKGLFATRQGKPYNFQEMFTTIISALWNITTQCCRIHKKLLDKYKIRIGFILVIVSF